jgi:soluble lytic murein transglycosylase
VIAILRWSCALALSFVCLPAAGAPAEPTAAERRAFLAAHDAALRGPPGRWQQLARGLEAYPLYAYIEHAALVRDLDRVDAQRVEAFLRAHRGTLLASGLRTRWLARLAREHRWAEFRANWRRRDDPALRCAYIEARRAQADTPALRAEAREVWLSPRSLPPACDAVLAWLQRSGTLDDDLRWQRIELAAAARESGLVRALAAGLSPAQRPEALFWSGAVADPGKALAGVATWPDSTRRRTLAWILLPQLARRDHDRAAALWPAVEQRYQPDATQRGAALAAIALWKAANYAPDAGAWMARVPDAAFDDALREWRVRTWLAAGNWAAALQAVEAMSPTQAADSRFRYLRARLLERERRGAEAAPLLDALAKEPNFHGFLAADRAGKPYSICPLATPTDAALRERVARRRALRRALEAHAIGWIEEARREWAHAFARLHGDERRAAVALAQQRGWTDRGPLSLLAPEDLRYYALRFPIEHRAAIESAAKRNGLETAWVLGLIRSESAWAADARSHADARGLMQLLPGTAQRLAKREKVPYKVPSDLFRPAINIPLGTAYLRDVLARFDGKEWLATGAYNAGPTPVARWLAQRPALDTDLWIETIPYKETREYVARVMAFSIIYDWRLRNEARSLAQRLGMAPATPVVMRNVVCAIPAAAPTAATPAATPTATTAATPAPSR